MTLIDSRNGEPICPCRRGDDILIRPISARYMRDKEVKSYEKENPNL